MTRQQRSVWIAAAAVAVSLCIAAAAVFRADRLIRPPAAPEFPASSVPVRDSLLLVPAGWFSMGTDSGEADERPVHRVWLDSFLIDLYPVTNAAYGRFLAETGRPQPAYWNDAKCNHPNQPVVGVRWSDAEAYCAWRSKKEGGNFRLPTEAEWEKAARGDDSRKYPWGNQPPDKKRAITEITERMPPVGICELGKSPYGVSDMVGTVWNWCADWYEPGYYATSPDSNPRGPAAQTRKGRVVRGGNWLFLGCCSGTPAYALRTTRRNAFNPMTQKKSVGFRCVKEM